MMNSTEFAVLLKTYEGRLEGLLSRFRSSQPGDIHLTGEDDALTRQTIQELLDLFNDNVRANPYSLRVAGIANEGITGWPERVSQHCVQELLSLVRAVGARVARNPEVVNGHSATPEASDAHWQLLHPTVQALGKSRMDSGHFADAVEACLKELNSVVKMKHHQVSGRELDGVDLMRQAFKLDSPSILLAQLTDETGRNIQRGYLDLFAGSMAGVRNPKAHGNVQITRERAIHFLFLASLLFFKLEEVA